MEPGQHLFDGIKRGDIETVRTLLEQTPTLANARDTNGLSAVLFSMYYQQPCIGRLLAEKASAVSIFQGAAVGDDRRVRELLQLGLEEANAVAADGFEPPRLAAFVANTQV